MRPRQLPLILATALTLFAQADVTLQRAMRKETLEGDLKGAIPLYEKAVAEAKRDRATAAKALIRMAECYQKLGDAEAHKLYERVIREYRDQEEAVAVARARLGALRPKPAVAGIVNRKVWELPRGGDILGTASADGRYIPYVAWAAGGDLFLHDLLTGTDRRLTNTATDKPGVKRAEEQYAEEYSISRDGKRLAYSWFRGDIDRYELRILALDGTSVPPFRTLLNNEEIDWMSPHDWTPDSKWIAVQLHRKDKSTQIGLISTEEGKLRVLKSVDWRGASGMFFSPDGKYLTYDLPAGESEQQRDIYLMAADGSREVPVVVHPSQDALLGWSPDGNQLLFASDRSGSMGLWSQRVAGGLAHGSPELLKSDIGEIQTMGIGSSGTLHYASWPRLGGDIQTATFDFNTGAFSSPPMEAVSTHVGSNILPDWSPDGGYLAYASRRSSAGSHYFVVGIRAVGSGQVREIVPNPNFQILVALSWSHDRKSLVIGGRDTKGRNGVFRMDAQTGRASMIVETKGAPRLAAESPDGKALYYFAMASAGEGGV
jgi:Tol biopolymer transport system component